MLKNKIQSVDDKCKELSLEVEALEKLIEQEDKAEQDKHRQLADLKRTKKNRLADEKQASDLNQILYRNNPPQFGSLYRTGLISHLVDLENKNFKEENATLKQSLQELEFRYYPPEQEEKVIELEFDQPNEPEKILRREESYVDLYDDDSLDECISELAGMARELHKNIHTKGLSYFEALAECLITMLKKISQVKLNDPKNSSACTLSKLGVLSGVLAEIDGKKAKKKPNKQYLGDHLFQLLSPLLCDASFQEYSLCDPQEKFKYLVGGVIMSAFHLRKFVGKDLLIFPEDVEDSGSIFLMICQILEVYRSVLCSNPLKCVYIENIIGFIQSNHQGLRTRYILLDMSDEPEVTNDKKIEDELSDGENKSIESIPAENRSRTSTSNRVTVESIRAVCQECRPIIDSAIGSKRDDALNQIFSKILQVPSTNKGNPKLSIRERLGILNGMLIRYDRENKTNIGLNLFHYLVCCLNDDYVDKAVKLDGPDKTQYLDRLISISIGFLKRFSKPNGFFTQADFEGDNDPNQVLRLIVMYYRTTREHSQKKSDYLIDLELRLNGKPLSNRTKETENPRDPQDAQWHQLADSLESFSDQSSPEVKTILVKMFNFLSEKLKTNNSLTVLKEHLRLVSSRSDLQNNKCLILGLSNLLSQAFLRSICKDKRDEVEIERMVAWEFSTLHEKGLYTFDPSVKDLDDIEQRIAFLREVVRSYLQHFQDGSAESQIILSNLQKIIHAQLVPGHYTKTQEGSIKINPNHKNEANALPFNTELVAAMTYQDADIKNAYKSCIALLSPINFDLLSASDHYKTISDLLRIASTIRRIDNPERKIESDGKIAFLNRMLSIFDKKNNTKNGLGLYYSIFPSLTDETCNQFKSIEPRKKVDFLISLILSSMRRLKSFMGPESLVLEREANDPSRCLGLVYTAIASHPLNFELDSDKKSFIKALSDCCVGYRDTLIQLMGATDSPSSSNTGTNKLFLMLEQRKSELSRNREALLNELDALRKANQSRDAAIEKGEEEVRRERLSIDQIKKENDQLEKRLLRYERQKMREDEYNELMLSQMEAQDLQQALLKRAQELDAFITEKNEEINASSSASTPNNEEASVTWDQLALAILQRPHEVRISLRMIMKLLSEKLNTQDPLEILREHLQLTALRSDLQINIKLVTGFTELLSPDVLDILPDNPEALNQQIMTVLMGSLEILETSKLYLPRQDHTVTETFQGKMGFLRLLAEFVTTHLELEEHYSQKNIERLKHIKENFLAPGKLACDSNGAVHHLGGLFDQKGNNGVKKQFHVLKMDPRFIMAAYDQCAEILHSSDPGVTNKEDVLQRIIGRLCRIKMKDGSGKISTGEKITSLISVLSSYDANSKANKCCKLLEYICPHLSDEVFQKYSKTSVSEQSNYIRARIFDTIKQLNVFSGSGTCLISSDDYYNGTQLIQAILSLSGNYSEQFPHSPEKKLYLQAVIGFISKNAMGIADEYQRSVPSHLTQKKQIVFNRKK